MKNKIKTFTLFIRPDKNSHQIADSIRKLNNNSHNPLIETNDGELATYSKVNIIRNKILGYNF